MRKVIIVFLLGLILSGCGSAETFETLGQIQHQPDFAPEASKVHLSLPESALVETFGGADTVYDCGGYTLVIQTCASGDFSGTVRSLSGFSPEKLTVLESGDGEVSRYDWIWTAAGEGGDILCRAAVLDDGNYHYCIYTMAPAQDAGALAEEWNGLFSSFSLE